MPQLRARGRTRTRTAALLLAANALAFAASAGPHDPLYVWSDAQGVWRYTTHLERIPLAERDSARPVGADDQAELSDQIEALERQIAADEAALGVWLSEEEAQPGDRSALREIAERLPRLQDQLRTLRAYRDASGDAATPGSGLDP